VTSRKKTFLKRCKVLLVDDHELVRHGMRLMLEALGCSVFEADSGEASLDVARRKNVDIVFMDIALPGIDGFTAASQLLGENSKLKLIILTGLRATSVPRAILQSGISGYMTKSAAAEEIEQAIVKVMAGEFYLSPEIAEQLNEAGKKEDTEASPFAKLSRREYQVVLSLLKGTSNDDVGEQLRVNAKTVSTYKRRAFAKLGVSSTADLITLARHWGLPVS
jgi:two-component system invasion response regulator UvrY